MDTLTVSGLTAHSFTRTERWVIFSALLAQVNDVHVGGVYNWTEEEHSSAASLIARLTGSPLGDVPATAGDSPAVRAVVQSILVPVYDLDHPELSAEEWSEAERILSELSQEFGI